MKVGFDRSAPLLHITDAHIGTIKYPPCERPYVMEVENHVPVDVRTQLLGESIESMEPWNDGGALIEFERSLGFGAIKRLNERGYVCGGLRVQSDGVGRMYIESDEL